MLALSNTLHSVANFLLPGVFPGFRRDNEGSPNPENLLTADSEKQDRKKNYPKKKQEAELSPLTLTRKLSMDCFCSISHWFNPPVPNRESGNEPKTSPWRKSS